MPCYRPLEAWRSLEDTSNGKKAISFKKNSRTTHPIKLACRRCIGCRLDQSLEWAIRCVHEARSHEQSCFITLTYSDDHLPWDGSLSQSHFTAFLKALRTEIKRKPIYGSKTVKFFGCGEYGEHPQTGLLNRPHYHLCLFGIDFPDKELYKEKEGILTWTSPRLEEIWGKGFCTTGDMNFDTAAYTARYVTKKITGDKAYQHYQFEHPITGQTIHLEPEFQRQSRGLGRTHYENYTTDMYPSSFLIHKNKRIKIPRYYDKRFELDEGDIEQIKFQRRQAARKGLADQTPERLEVREKVTTLRHDRYRRNYETQNV